MLCLIGAFSLLIVSYCLLFICSATTVSLVEMVSWIPFGHKIGVILFCILFYLIGFRFLHTYSNVIRFSSFVDLSHIALANIIGTLCVIIIRLLFVDNENTIFPGLRITLFAFCFGTLAMWAIRVMVKTLFDVVDVSVNAKNIYIYGTKALGVSIAKSVRNQHPSKYIVKGFISPSGADKFKYLVGLPVYNVGKELIRRMKRDDIDGVIVSPHSTVEFCADQEFIDILTDNGIKIIYDARRV